MTGQTRNRKVDRMNFRLTLLASCVPALLAAQSVIPPARPAARAVRVATAPLLDGWLDAPVWAASPVPSGFQQHEPFDGRAATERTEVRIVFDDQATIGGFYTGHRAGFASTLTARPDEKFSTALRVNWESG